MGRQLGEKALMKRVKKVVKDNEELPFGASAPAVIPKSFGDQQRNWASLLEGPSGTLTECCYTTWLFVGLYDYEPSIFF